jgi:hypothetical protein
MVTNGCAVSFAPGSLLVWSHVLELSGPELTQIREGRTFSNECSGTSHTHVVTFN